MQQHADLSSAQVKNMDNMFREATAFSSDLSRWDVGNVINMEAMFNLATAFSGNVSTWNVSNVLTMQDMFKGAVRFNDDVSSWDVRKVRYMGGMFSGAISYNYSLCAWATRLPPDVDLEGAFVSTRCSAPAMAIGNSKDNDAVGLSNMSFCGPCSQSSS
jgi:surface protein